MTAPSTLSPRASLRLQTVLLLRWLAVTGQCAAVLVGQLVLDINVPLGPISVVIGALVLANLVSSVVHPITKRLTDEQAGVVILFDVVQLGLLLALTGGLSNPFLMLILAPIAVGAPLLPFGALLGVCAVAIAAVSLPWLWHLPLVRGDGTVLELPDLIQFGAWTAAVIGIGFVAIYARRISAEMRAVDSALMAMETALNREQRLTDLSGIVAAAAHEMGTPLATITLVSAELTELLADQPELADDAKLIRSQADRCRDILRAMGQTGKDDLLIKQAPAQAIIEEAAEPHMNRGIDINITAQGGPAPDLHRRAELIHGLRNLIQNAVDFAQSRVNVTVIDEGERLTIRIADDGPGYPPSIIGQLGTPDLPRRRSAERGEYEGMGLGLFIAKTLLERTGAKLSFANGTGERQGAIAALVWQRDQIVADTPRRQLGENRALKI